MASEHEPLYTLIPTHFSGGSSTIPYVSLRMRLMGLGKRKESGIRPLAHREPKKVHIGNHLWLVGMYILLVAIEQLIMDVAAATNSHQLFWLKNPFTSVLYSGLRKDCIYILTFVLCSCIEVIARAALGVVSSIRPLLIGFGDARAIRDAILMRDAVFPVIPLHEG
jgi:hypothetical protein